MSQDKSAPVSNQRVLATMNQDGSRHWIRPKLSPGKYQKLRFWVAWGLMLIFSLTPHLRYQGKPWILLDIPSRQFVFWGHTFLATDSLLLLLLLLTIFLSIFLFTAMFGRVWCGWACPQTVYMEFLFRPIERLFEGSAGMQRRMDKHGGGFRRIAKNFVFLLVALFLAHTFLAYFVGTHRLWIWMQRSPFEHPTTFLIMMGTTAAIFYDFAFFREQTCLVACPYGRFQSVLLDKDSLIVGYDYKRGESRSPKGKRKKASEEEAANFGDCIDCKACVLTCPTGIDIRDGLQMECINCTQCMDACDAIMTKINKPTGLIRYTSQNQLEKKQHRFLRIRVVVYPLLLLFFFSIFMWMLWNRGSTKITLMHMHRPYKVVNKTKVANFFRVKFKNRTSAIRKYKITMKGIKEAKLVNPFKNLSVGALDSRTITFFVEVPMKALKNRRPKVQIIIRDDTGFKHTIHSHLLSPAGGK